MIALNLFGLFAVTAMLVCHALERRKSLNLNGGRYLRASGGVCR